MICIVIIHYRFYVSHAHLLSGSKCAATPIYQFVSMHKSTYAGIRRATLFMIFITVQHLKVIIIIISSSKWAEMPFSKINLPGPGRRPMSVPIS